MAQAMKIAIVDDEQDMRQSISQWLALSGYDTETFASAEDALKTLGPEYPGIVISDIKMPGMDGLETTRRLRQAEGAGRRTPVIALTANAAAADRRACLEAGMDDFLVKPVAEEALSGVIARWTEREAQSKLRA